MLKKYIMNQKMLQNMKVHEQRRLTFDVVFYLFVSVTFITVATTCIIIIKCETMLISMYNINTLNIIAIDLNQIRFLYMLFCDINKQNVSYI